jgi:hypothetical protein
MALFHENQLLTALFPCGIIIFMKLCLGSVTETCCGIDCLSFHTCRNSPLSCTPLFYSKYLSKTLHLACFQYDYALSGRQRDPP